MPRRLLPVIALLSMAAGPEDIDAILERSGIPPEQRYPRGYSDFTDPLGRFMDMMAAGAAGDAKALLADACAAWRRRQPNTAWSGKFWVRNIEVDLNALCRLP